ncbi:MAG: hypothetical protein RL494_441, partial [Bacteroidota bacterium]
INGGSTQLEGVASDVAIPDRYSYIKIGERDVEKAMPWDKIEQAPYRIQKPVSNFETLVANSKKRVAENPQFKLIDENAKWINDRKEDDVVSLNINKFKAEQAQREEETKKFKAITKFENQLVFNSLSPELELIKKDSTLGRKRKDWHENLAKDAYIEEALNVLGDMVPAAVVNKKVAFKNKL